MYIGIVVKASFCLERDTKRIKAAFSVFPLCYTELVLLTQFCIVYLHLSKGLSIFDEPADFKSPGI